MSAEVRAENLFAGSGPGVFGAPVAQEPGSRLDHYVLLELPSQLRDLSDGEIDFGDLAAKQTTVLEAAEKDVFRNTEQDEALTTQLDLLFMLGGFLPAGKEAFAKAPPSLLSLLTYNRERFGIPGRMDYDLIIDQNTRTYLDKGQVRVYTDEPSAALHERDFYIGHHFAEAHVKAAAFSVRSLVELPKHVDGEAVLGSAVAALDTFQRWMGAYRRMPNEDFTYFRQFLSSYPDDVRNASGAFMPSVQLLELALHKPTGEYQVFLDESEPYFPAWSRPVLKSQRGQSMEGRNIADMINTGELSLSDEERGLLGDLIETFIKFRIKHLGITYEQVTEAFAADPRMPRRELEETLTNNPEGNIMEQGMGRGTAGFNVDSVLKNSIRRLFDLKTRVAPDAKQPTAPDETV